MNGGREFHEPSLKGVLGGSGFRPTWHRQKTESSLGGNWELQEFSGTGRKKDVTARSSGKRTLALRKGGNRQTLYPGNIVKISEERGQTLT